MDKHFFAAVWCPFLFAKKGDKRMQKPLRDQLRQWEKKHKEIIRNNREMNKKENSKRKPEKLSDRDLIELMDMNKPTYRRAKGGAIRRR